MAAAGRYLPGRRLLPPRLPAHAGVPDTLTLGQLERFLMSAANILRGKTDASEYREYI